MKCSDAWCVLHYILQDDLKQQRLIQLCMRDDTINMVVKDLNYQPKNKKIKIFNNKFTLSCVHFHLVPPYKSKFNNQTSENITLGPPHPPIITK